MKNNYYLIAVILVGLSASNSLASTQPSPSWQEAKEAFTPINDLRAGTENTQAASTDGTTMRLLGVDKGESLTVFPPMAELSQQGETVAESRQTAPISQAQETVQVPEPQVVGMTYQPVETNQQHNFSQPSAQAQPGSQNASLILLPAIESASSTFLVSSRSDDRLAYATQAYAAEEAVAPAESDPAAGQYVQGDGTIQWGAPVVTPGCCEGCCDSCCTPCRKPCCPCICVVGVEAVFLSPEINGTPVFYRYDDFDIGETLLFGPAFGEAAMDDFYGAPRIWAGWQGCCWGIVGRYYHYRSAEHDHDPLVPDGDYDDHSYDVNNLLEAYYTDIELTRNFCLHGCKSQFTFGARYALIEHHEAIYGRSITDEGSPDEGLLEGYARRNRQAHGTGLTMSLNGRKPLFCNSCAHWFFNVRSSILWGCTHNEVESETSALAGGGAVVAAAGSIDTATARVDDDLFIGEVQVGLQWDFALRCLPAKAFFRTAFEYQYWDASSGLAASGSFAGITGPSTQDFQVTTGSSAPGLIVDFVGLSIGSGFTW